MDEITTHEFPERQIADDADAMDTPDMAVEEAVPQSGGDPAVATPLDIMAVVNRDVRAAHFLVDLLSGQDSDKAIELNFGIAKSGPDPEAIEAAERRGYLRGLNERAEAVMSRPGAYEEIRPQRHDPDSVCRPLLSPSGRQSVWDLD